MRKLICLSIIPVTVLLLAGSSIPAEAQKNIANAGEPLYRFSFPKESDITLSETPGGHVLIVAAGYDENGQVLRYNPADDLFQQLIAFNGKNGQSPCGELAFLDDPNLVYGVTQEGGEAGKGLLYALDVNTGTQMILYDFKQSPNAAAPSKGLRRVDAHTLMGLVEIDQKTGLFTFDLRSKRPQFHPIACDSVEYTVNLPVMLSENTCAFLLNVQVSMRVNGKKYSATKYAYIAEYDLHAGKVTHLSIPLKQLRPMGNLVKAKDGCLYTGENFALDDEEEGLNFLFARYDPSTKKITHMVRPPNDFIAFGPPLSADREGNITGAFLYGGTDNGGYIFRYDPVTGQMQTVKDWQEGSPGVMTCSSALVHHRTGNIYGISSSGGKDYQGRFFCLDPVTGNAKALAGFKPEE